MEKEENPLVRRVPKETGDLSQNGEENEKNNEEGETIELLKKNGVYERDKEISYHLDQEFRKAIDEGLLQLEEGGYEDDRKFRIWVEFLEDDGEPQEEMETTAGELRRIVQTMREKNNPISHGKPFRFTIVLALHTMQEEREMDERHAAQEKKEILKNLGRFQDNQLLWYALQQDPYDPLSLSALKRMKAGDIRRSIEAEKGEFVNWWGLRIISDSPTFQPEKYEDEIEAAKETRRKALALIADLPENEVIEVLFSDDRKSTKMPVSSVRWRIETMNKEELKELSRILSKQAIGGKILLP